jgi:protein-disulfide isomerase
MSRESKIMVAVLVIVVGGMIGLFALANKSAPAPKGSKTIVLATSHKEGSGPVQLVEFGDYECPACGAAYPNLQKLLQTYQGKITFYFRNFPLTSLHPNAMAGAEAAEAAALQGKFWQMHDLLYSTQTSWANLADPTSTFVADAQSLGLDTTKFQSDMTSSQVKQTIQKDMADGNALGIDATPTLYFDGKQFAGGYGYDALNTEVQSLLKK